MHVIWSDLASFRKAKGRIAREFAANFARQYSSSHFTHLPARVSFRSLSLGQRVSSCWFSEPLQQILTSSCRVLQQNCGYQQELFQSSSSDNGFALQRNGSSQREEGQGQEDLGLQPAHSKGSVDACYSLEGESVSQRVNSWTCPVPSAEKPPSSICKRLIRAPVTSAAETAQSEVLLPEVQEVKNVF